MNSIHLKSILSTTCLVASLCLTGCGGGGGSDTDLRQYVGTWSGACVKTGSGQSEGQVLEFRENASTASELSGSKVVHFYGNTSCSGTPRKTAWYYLTGSLAGTRDTSSGKAAMVMVQLSDPNGGGAAAAYAELLLLKDGRLYLGNRATLQSDGYPGDIDPSLSLGR